MKVKRYKVLISFFFILCFLCFFIQDVMVSAEPVTATGSLVLYFALAAVSAGVVWHNTKDIKSAYSSFVGGLSMNEKLSYATRAISAITDVFTDKFKASINDSTLLNWLKSKFRPGYGNVPLAEYYEYYQEYNYFPMANFTFPHFDYIDLGKSGETYAPSLEYHFKIINNLLSLYRSMGTKHGGNQYRSNISFYLNGQVIFQIYDVLVPSNRYFVHPNIIDGTLIGYCLSDSLLKKTVEDGAFCFIPIDNFIGYQFSSLVNYDINLNSFLGSEKALDDVTLPGLPYVPGVATQDLETGTLSFPGTLQDVIDSLTTNEDFLEAVLETLIGKTNTYIGGLPGLDIDVEDGCVVVPDAGVYPEDLTDIGSLPLDTDIDLPEDIAIPDDTPLGLGWLYYLIKMIYNLLQNIFNAFRVLLNNILSILNGIWEWIKNLFKPGTVSLDFSSLFNVPISDKFPFCIPFDLYNAFSTFNVVGQAPCWDIDFLDTSFVIDFAIFESWAVIVRWGVLILFNLGLIKITRDLVGG